MNILQIINEEQQVDELGLPAFTRQQKASKASKQELQGEVKDLLVQIRAKMKALKTKTLTVGQLTKFLDTKGYADYPEVKKALRTAGSTQANTDAGTGPADDVLVASIKEARDTPLDGKAIKSVIIAAVNTGYSELGGNQSTGKFGKPKSSTSASSSTSGESDKLDPKLVKQIKTLSPEQKKALKAAL
jgi:hypothetical protein